MAPCSRCRRPITFGLLSLNGLLLGGTAGATVSPAQGEPPAPTVVVLQQADLATLGPGVRARPGDYRLEYGTVAFVVSQPGTPDGGTLTDVVQLFPWARRLGLDSARTRVAGRDVVFVRGSVSRSRDLATVQLEGYDSEDPRVEVRTQFQLGPAVHTSDALRIVTTVKNGGPRPLHRYVIGDDIQWGSLTRFAPGAGLATPPTGRALPYLLGLSAAGALLYLPGTTAPGTGSRESPGVHGPTWSEISCPAQDLAPGASARCSRVLQVLAEPARALCRGPAPLFGQLPVRGLVREDGAGAIVLLERPNGQAVAATLATEGGRFTLCAPTAGSYRLRAEAPGRALPAPLPLQVGPAGAAQENTLTLPRPAHLHVSLREIPPGRTAPGRLSVQPLDALPARVVSAGTLPHLAENGLLRVATPGEVDLLLPPGRYRVTASRGPFYEIHSQEVALRAGETRRLTLALRRGVPPSAMRAVQCTVLRALPAGDPTLIAARAEGLDLVLGTSATAGHTDPPTVPAAEVVTSKHGRLVAYPLQAGALVPELRQVQALGEALRRLPGEDNEPPAVQGTLAAASPLDALELWSGAAPDPAALHSWLAQLAEGRLVPAVASAEPRAELLQLGAPRTCFSAAPSARPRSPGAHLRAALRHGDLLLTNGPWLMVTANGADPGKLAAAPDGQVAVNVSVLASSFVDVREVELWVGPRQAARVPVPPTGTSLRYRGTLRVTLDRDAPIVVMARGNRPLDPVAPGATPLAISNPLFIDRDGDGRFLKATPGQ